MKKLNIKIESSPSIKNAEKFLLLLDIILSSENLMELRTNMISDIYKTKDVFLMGFGASHFWVAEKDSNNGRILIVTQK